MNRPELLLISTFAFVGPAAAGEIPGATIVLEVTPPPTPGRIQESAPLRFVLLGTGQVFVGGTSDIGVGRLDSGEVKTLEGRVETIRKLKGLGSEVSFGTGATRYRLSIRKSRPLDIVATGDPAATAAPFRPLALLLQDLASFSHPTLRPYRAEAYAVAAREESLTGGCRPWTFPVPISDCLAAPRAVPAALAATWPTGALPASVCVGDKRYRVTVRPLLPGELP